MLSLISDYFGLFSTGIGFGILLGSLFAILGIFVGSMVGIVARG